MTKEQQNHFLNKRILGTGMMGMGKFSSFGSYLYAFGVARIHTNNPEVANTRLKSLPDPSYKPTMRELFNEIAKQTSSSCSYNAERRHWLFFRPLPFTIKIAEGWISQPQVGYMFYKPPTAPVGMDIMFAGSTESDESAKQARERLAIQYAKPFKSDVQLSEMKEVVVGAGKALFYTTETKKGVIWRQWVIVTGNRCFVIVSAIKPEHENTILPDVKNMVQSFRIVN